MSILNVTEKELKLVQMLQACTEALTATTKERDALKADLVFVERWANHHGTKSCHSAESILGVIQHYPTIHAITKSYADGVVPDTPDPYAERDKMAAENKVLRDALDALVSISNDACIGPWEVARAALARSKP